MDCFRNANDVLVAREGHCQGYPYSAEKRRCVDHSEKPDCVTKGVRNSFRASDFNGLCAEGEPEAGCVNCKMTFYCIKGNATIGACDANTVCDNSKEEFGNSVCLPPATLGVDNNCKCDGIGLFADHYDPSYFHFCSSDTAIPEIFACEGDKEFNDVTQACEINPGQPPTPPCDGKIGTFVNPNDCTWSYTCLPGDEVRVTYCLSDEYFKEGGCVKKCTIGEAAAIGTCEEAGFLPYPDNCSKFLFCPNGGGESPEEKKCPDGLFYNDKARRCIDDTLPERCEPEAGQNYRECPGHEDFDFSGC